MIDKIKVGIKYLFSKKKTEEELFRNRITRNKKIIEFFPEQDFYKLKISSKINVFCRNYLYSDFLVFEQIFNFEEYRIIKSLFKLNKIDNKEIIIIDAGANVGYASLYFLEEFDSVRIFGIEPSKENMNIYKKNVEINNFQDNVKFYERALSEKINSTFNINRDFRDGKDWAISTKETDNGLIKGVTIDEIINENKLNKISLLKIDIEGAERFIFNKNNDLSFLKITEIIAIEIHDEFNIRSEINSILIENNFLLFQTGELTIGLNKHNFIK